MKRIGNLYSQAFTRDALLAAFAVASRGKRASRACYQFERRLAWNIDNLVCELNDGSYRPASYFSFSITKPKPRVIYAPAFRDLVVQHAIYHVVLPIFEAGFIDQSFACRTGKGTHMASDYAQSALRAVDRDSYTLKLDIRKFFYRIDRGILRRLVEQKIKDRRLVDLMMAFADHGQPVGTPIGNLLSQLYALIYLSPLDHMIKRVLKVRRYCRYVDDFVLFGLTREQAVDYRARIVEYLATELRLELSKSTISKTLRGINFVGYRTWATRRFVRKHSLFTFRRAVARGNWPSAASCLGHAARTHSYRAMKRHYEERQS